MTTAYHITRAASPINNETYESIDAALSAARAPRWAGDKGAEITMLSETTYKSGGDIYTIEAGENPRAAREAERATPKAKSGATVACNRKITSANLAYHMYDPRGALYG